MHKRLDRFTGPGLTSPNSATSPGRSRRLARCGCGGRSAGGHPTSHGSHSAGVLRTGLVGPTQSPPAPRAHAARRRRAAFLRRRDNAGTASRDLPVQIRIRVLAPSSTPPFLSRSSRRSYCCLAYRPGSIIPVGFNPSMLDKTDRLLYRRNLKLCKGLLLVAVIHAVACRAWLLERLM
jgi:hypothetical protein